MRRKTTLRMTEYDDRGEMIRDVSVSGDGMLDIWDCKENLLEPVLLAWGYQSFTVKDLFGEGDYDSENQAHDDQRGNVDLLGDADD